MARQDFYVLLGVKKDAPVEEIRRAYRRWAIKLCKGCKNRKGSANKIKLR